MLIALPLIAFSKFAILWVILALAAFAVHFFRKDYISLSVAIGAVVTAFAVMFGYSSLLVQALVFVITTIVFLASFIPAMIEQGNQKHHRHRDHRQHEGAGTRQGGRPGIRGPHLHRQHRPGRHPSRHPRQRQGHPDCQRVSLFSLQPFVPEALFFIPKTLRKSRNLRKLNFSYISSFPSFLGIKKLSPSFGGTHQFYASLQ